MDEEIKEAVEYTVRSVRWLLAHTSSVYGKLSRLEKNPQARMSSEEYELKKEKALLEIAWREISKYHSGFQEIQIRLSNE